MEKARKCICLLLTALMAFCAGCSVEKPAAPAAPPTDTPAASAAPTVASTPPAETPAPLEMPAPPEASAGQIDDLSVYAPVLEETCDILQNGFDSEKEYHYVSTGVIEMAAWLSPDELLADVGYTICDISGDGVPELLIGTLPGDAEDAGLLYGGYTVKDGQVVAFLEGWARNRYQMLDDGCFYNAGSGGAMYSMFGAWRIAPDGAGLICEDFYFTWEKDAGSPEPGFYHNTTGVWDKAAAEELDMDEDGFWQLMESYEERCVSLELTPFSDYKYAGNAA
jgi:hypothetical protein